jgi:glutamate-5-semialdehyde dehydrogenase
MSLHDEIREIGERAARAAREMALLPARKKNQILEAMAEEIEARRETILEANRRDMEAGRAAGLPAAMLDRLALDDERLGAMVRGLRTVAGLKDPVGARISRWIRPNGLVIQKVRVPIGVIAIIYEARPNVTADAAGLCVKTANAVILRGGSEARRSSQTIAEALQAGGAPHGLPEGAVQYVAHLDHDAVREIVRLEGLVDLVIPRGGEGLIRAVTEEARVPVIKHYKGVCHLYVDESADLDMALNLAENAKCQRPGVCNAIEKVLVHAKIAPVFLPRLVERLGARGVEFRGDETARAIVPTIRPATDADWTAEYLDLLLAVKVVADVHEAARHINRYGSHHSDAIAARSEVHQRAFADEVDSAAVYINASTRFTDGGEFGMGAEIGISTDKLHARGPMGLEELTTYKYVIWGDGQVRE